MFNNSRINYYTHIRAGYDTALHKAINNILIIKLLNTSIYITGNPNHSPIHANLPA